MKEVTAFPISDIEVLAARDIKICFDAHGSDKSTYHNYENFYGPILADREKVASVFEVGIGTTSPEFLSNMGATGSPGASLRALRDFLPNAHVYGADIDRGVFFNEERIDTYFLSTSSIQIHLRD